MTEKKLNMTPLLFSIFIIAICGIIYELIIGGTSSYLIGDSIKQFSMTIGLYMSAMGVGSYLSKHFKRKLLDVFAVIELAIGLIGGISALVLFAAYAYTKLYVFVMYLTIILIGILVGLEIPVLTRIIEEEKNELRITLANVLSFDYIGALLGSISFPLLLFPHLGFIRTSFLVGMLNAAVAGYIIFYYQERLQLAGILKTAFLAIGMILLTGFIQGDFSANEIEQHLYRDQIVFSKQTPYQNIVVTKHREDVRLFLNGNLQFSSSDEYRYHEALVHPAMSLAKHKNKVLILGGGDGFVVRELLKYSDIQSIDLVDLDQQMVEFCKTNELITQYNMHSMDTEKLRFHYMDAYKFLEESKQLFDVVIVDLPDPNNESLNKLYTNVFYRLIGNHLTPEGVLVAQSTSPYFTKEAYWCIVKTVGSEGFYTKAYHVQVPSFGDWGFTLGRKSPFEISDMKVEVPTRFLNPSVLQSMFVFAKDEKLNMDEVTINRISHSVLLKYYEKSQEKN